MQFYVIPPRKNINLSHLGDNRYFCLAQQYKKDANYASFFKNLPSTAWITLDSGVGDFDALTNDELFDVMKELMPSEVIPLDVLFDADQTITNAVEFYEKMVQEGLQDKIEIFFAPQGNTQFDWIDCYMWALEQPWIKTIGLSKIGVPKAFLGVGGDRGIMEARHNCFNYLKVHNLLKKPLHLLGMGDPREFTYYAEHDIDGAIRSSDSCNTVWSAMNGLSWEHGQYERIPTPKDYFDREVPEATPYIDEQTIQLSIPGLIESNVNFLKSLCKK